MYYRIAKRKFRFIASLTMTAIAVCGCFSVLIAQTPPVAVEDEIYTWDNVPTSGDLSDNDLNPDNSVLTYSLLTSTNYGILDVEPNGSWTFNPYPEVAAVNQTLQYQVCDNNGQCDIGDIGLFVQFHNDPPEPQDDYLTVEMNNTRFGSVADNDYDPDYLSDPVSTINNYVSITTPSNGTILFNLDGTFEYTPNTGFTGSDSFSYINCDACSVCATATVFLNVIGNNDDPVAISNGLTTLNEDTPLISSLSFYVSDPENDQLVFQIVGNPQHGMIVMNNDGSFYYSPDPDFYGNDSFSYIACDIVGQCAFANFYLEVINQNDAPIASNDFFTTNEDIPSFIANASLNDSDDSGSPEYTTLQLPEHGSLILQSNGIFTYTPEANYNGLDTFLLNVCDLQLACAVSTVVIEVTPMNDVPQAINDDYFGYEDEVLTGSLNNDIDIDGDLLNFSLIASDPGGLLTIDPNGDFSLQPNANFSGFINASYQVCDSNSACDFGTITIEIIEINDDPIINSDSFFGLEDSQIFGDVRLNDIEPDGEAIFYFTVSNPLHGTLLLNSNGTFVYTPEINWTGSETISFYGCDPCSVCGLATLTIEVLAVNDAPSLATTYLDVLEDDEISLDITTEISDPDSDNWTYSISTQPSNGLAYVDMNGLLQYQPNPNYNGNDEILITVCDDSVACDLASIIINVLAVNDSPIAFDDNYAGPEDIDIYGTLANDFDLDNNDLNFTLQLNPESGTIVINTDGTFTYNPNPDFHGTDSLTYLVCDNSNACDTGTLFLTITPVNDIPQANDDNNVTYQNNLLEGSVTTNDSDVDGDLLSYITISTTTNGQFTLNNDGSYTYLPYLDFSGNDQATYEVCDGQNACSTATIYLTIFTTNTAPIATELNLSTDEDIILSGELSSTVNDSEGGVLNFSVLDDPSFGSLNLQPGGSYVYTPSSNFSGVDQFSYRVCDTGNMCDTAIVNIEINTVNDPPVIIGESFQISEDTELSNNVSLNDSDAESTNLLYSIITTSVNGLFELNETGTFSYVPNPDFFGTEQIAYRACDEQDVCNEGILTIDVAPINDSPIAVADTYSNQEDHSIEGDVSSNDSDVDNSQLSFTLITTPAFGTLDLNLDGTFNYVPFPNYNGNDVFEYMVCDQSDYCSSAIAEINLISVNDAPNANDDFRTINEDHIASGNLSLNDNDADNDALSFFILSSTLHGILNLESNGDFNYTPEIDFYGSDSAQVEICDPFGSCVQSMIYIDVLPLNDSPIATNEAFNGLEDETIFGNVGVNDTDIDGDVLSFSSTSPATLGSFIMENDGSFSFVPFPDANGFEIVNYTVCDSENECAEGTIAFTLSSVNDIPEANGEYQNVAEDTWHQEDLGENDNDADGDPLTFTVIEGPYHGTITLETSVYTYTPTPDYWGMDSVTYEVCDPFGLCSIATIVFEVDFVNDPPVVVSEAIEVQMNQTVYGTVADNEIEYDFEQLVYFIYQDDSNGIFTLNEDGTFTYTPNENVTGEFTLTYYACDPCSVCDEGVLTIYVVSEKDANTAPVLTSFQTSSCHQGTTIINMAELIADNEDEDLSLGVTFGEISAGEIAFDSESLTLTYTSVQPDIQEVILPYTVCDNGLVPICVTDTITIQFTDDILPQINSFVLSPVDCFGGNNGSIDLQTFTGGNNFTFVWDNDSTSEDLQNLSAGIYNVLISSDASCMIPQNYSFEITQPEAPISAELIASTNISDENNGTIAIDVVGGTPPYSVQWTGPDNFEFDGEDLENLVSQGDYHATITDANGCETELENSITGTQNQNLSFDITISPNPFSNNVNVNISNSEGPCQVEIFDMEGRLVHQSVVFSNKFSIETSNLASGCYELRLSNAMTIHSQKIIRE